MLESVLRAVASLIVVTCLILWLGKSASSGGFAARMFARFGNTPMAAAHGAKLKPKKPRGKQASSNTLKTWGAKFAGAGTKGAGAPQVLSVAARQVLLGTSGVAVVDIDGQRLVLGVTDSQVTLLTTLEVPAPVVDVDAELETETDRGSEPADRDQSPWAGENEVSELELALKELETRKIAEIDGLGVSSDGNHTFAGGRVYSALPEPAQAPVEVAEPSEFDFETTLRKSLVAQEELA